MDFTIESQVKVFSFVHIPQDPVRTPLALTMVPTDIVTPIFPPSSGSHPTPGVSCGEGIPGLSPSSRL